MKLISFDLKADFAFFRKPETNGTINLSYNIIHRPAVLGVLGAILGLDGYQEKGKLPQYFDVLKDIRIGVEPLNHEKGNYSKTNIKYSNTIGYANKGANFLTEELTLVAPEYRIYLLLDEQIKMHVTLAEHLVKGMATYIPYLGKNEFTAWWEPETYTEYSFLPYEKATRSIQLQTVFQKHSTLKSNIEGPGIDLLNFGNEPQPFIYFERLPLDFNLDLMQYAIGEFVFSNYYIKNPDGMQNLYLLKELNTYVQLF
ncbi:type I-B CRISPR-associated protein Cas5b [Chitinophaga solisilvae]|uniref:type I-B CRISPR-associated protein Cas5b n=1 Tax=Chitinophaga solisilvae TaxID=1233460 RepID=UPI00136D1D83|nr:type I-B CRISPR-associated protein Cas5b [Chitinophaga solisilvae]